MSTFRDPSAAQLRVGVDPVDAIDASEYTGFGGGKLAATVVVLRDGTDGLEVWVQERVHTMRNYPGHVVFPGGGVDPRDFPPRTWDSGELWSGASAISMARAMGVTRYKAHAVLFAAARELFEEAGMLLTRSLAGDVVDNVRPFHHQRAVLESHAVSFTEFLIRYQLKLDADMLKPWARWAGVDNDQWFDTFFFITTSPAGQEPDGATFEADDANWFSPSLLLDGWREGLVRLALPTWAQLCSLAQCASVADAMKKARTNSLKLVIGEPRDEPLYEEFFRHTPTDRIGRQR